MTEINNYLFAYGTLLIDGNEFGDFLRKKCPFYGPGKVKGKLYDIGEYPGVILHPDEQHVVIGHIYQMNDAEATLKILDPYEGIGKNSDQPDEYVRKIAPVETDDELLDCWVYEYNFPVDNYKQVISGDYLKYIGL